jgi:hypothetical protein
MTCFCTSNKTTTLPMKKFVLSILLAVLPLALFGASGTAIPGGNQAAPFIINKPGAYYLAANRVMTTKGGSAIEITASDVTLDLNGYTLSYVDSEGAGTGVTVTSSNVEIRNGSICTVPYNAIFTKTGAGIRIIDVRMADTGGITLNSEGSRVERCHIVDSRGFAVSLSGWGSVLTDCQIHYVQPFPGSTASYGVYVSTYCRVIGNDFDATNGPAIYCTGARAAINDNQVTRANLSKSSEAAGILVTSGNVSLRGNAVLETQGTGIHIAQNAIGCVVDHNVVNRTVTTGPLVGAGIVSQTPTTILRGNLGSSNGGGLIVGTFVDGGNNVGN